MPLWTRITEVLHNRSLWSNNIIKTIEKVFIIVLQRSQKWIIHQEVQLKAWGQEVGANLCYYFFFNLFFRGNIWLASFLFQSKNKILSNRTNAVDQIALKSLKRKKTKNKIRQPVPLMLFIWTFLLSKWKKKQHLRPLQDYSLLET